MKIKSVTVAIILAFPCVMVVNLCDASGQTHRRTKSQQRRTIKRAPAPTQPEETEAEKEKAALEAAIQNELDALTKLPSDQQLKLRSTVASLQRIVRKVQLAGFPKYFLQEMQEGTEKDVNECLAFLPEGMTKKSLAYSWRALLDSWHLNWSAESGIVDNQSLAIVDRYELEAGNAYGLSRDVLQLTVKRLTFLAVVIQTAFNATP
jgi:hypothetical protein